ncbi:MAG: YitT family protein [Bacillota bacterium]
MIPIQMLRYLLAVTGAVCMAVSLELFYIPHGLMDGGMAGAAVILGRTAGLPPVYLLVPLNAACLFAGIGRLGRAYVTTTAAGLFAYGLVLRLVGPLSPLLSLPAAIVLGGAGVGLGVGLLLRAGGAVDGCETLGLLIQAYYGISAVAVLLLANVVVFGLAIWLWGLGLILPSLAAQTVGLVVVVWVVRRRC